MAIALETAPGLAGPSFDLSEEQELLRGEIRRFAEERIGPGVAERDARREFPAEIVREPDALYAWP